MCLQCKRYRRWGFGLYIRKIPGERVGNPLHYSCLKNPMNREAWQATVRRTAKCRTKLSSRLSTRLQHCNKCSVQLLTLPTTAPEKLLDIFLLLSLFNFLKLLVPYYSFTSICISYYYHLKKTLFFKNKFHIHVVNFSDQFCFVFFILYF